jgi:hypothetical protein
MALFEILEGCERIELPMDTNATGVLFRVTIPPDPRFADVGEEPVVAKLICIYRTPEQAKYVGSLTLSANDDAFLPVLRHALSRIEGANGTKLSPLSRLTHPFGPEILCTTNLPAEWNEDGPDVATVHCTGVGGPAKMFVRSLFDEVTA